MAGPWSADASGIDVSVRLTPKGGRDSIDGVATLSDGQAVVKARVRAAPTEGQANAALVGLLAKTFRVAPRQVSIVGGEAARIKRVRIEGDARVLTAALEKIVAAH
jgi:uncharacterized protein (TIGR00251 family)